MYSLDTVVTLEVRLNEHKIIIEEGNSHFLMQKETRNTAWELHFW
jgi:hypothetical protein